MGQRAQEYPRTALLLGSDHTGLGEMEVREIAPNVAIGISRGRFPKAYPHVDPNEDAVFAFADGTTAILAVADGHQGFDAANAAIGAVAESATFAGDQYPEILVRSCVRAAISAVNSTIPSLPPPRNASETALTIAAIRGGKMSVAVFGDTSCTVATRIRTSTVGSSSSFLAPGADPEIVPTYSSSLPSRGTVVVASDGVLDFARTGTRSLRSTWNQSPRDAVERVIAAAFAGGAGDNIAVAAFAVSDSH